MKVFKIGMTIFLGFMVLVVAIIIIVAVASQGNNKASQPTYPRDPGSTVSSSLPLAVSGPLTTVGNGTYLVGTDMEAGSYRSPGSNMCYYARLHANNGALGDIIENNVGSGPQRFTANDGEFVRISGGCTFQKVG